METNRRDWIRQMSLAIAGASVAPLSTFAFPSASSSAGNGTIRLSSNENPYGPPPSARTAMANAVSSSNRYPWEMIRELMVALATKHALTDEHIVLGAGSTTMLDLMLRLAAQQKGSCLSADPGFTRWALTAEQLGMQHIKVPLTADKKHDLPAMLKAIQPDTRLVYICNPNNPTGTVCNHQELVSFIQEVAKQRLVVIDEAYLEFAGEPSVSHLVADTKNILVVKTFSKIYGMAGARIGYALAHPDTIKQLGNVQYGPNMGISAVSLAGALAALKDTEFVQRSYSLNSTARAYTLEQFQRLNISCIPSHTNFIYFSLLQYPKDFFELLKKNKIEGTGIFEETGKWSRITIGTMEDMQQLVRVLG